MNKGRTFKFFLLIILSISVLNGYFVQASISKKSDIISIEVVEELLVKRLEIMNRAFYEEDFDIKSTKLDLEAVERGQILEEDLDYIQKLKEEPSCVEYVHNLRVLNIFNTESKDNLYNFQTKVIWYMFEHEGKELEIEVAYSIEILREKDMYYLLSIRPIEK